MRRILRDSVVLESSLRVGESEVSWITTGGKERQKEATGVVNRNVRPPRVTGAFPKEQLSKRQPMVRGNNKRKVCDCERESEDVIESSVAVPRGKEFVSCKISIETLCDLLFYLVYKFFM